MRSFAFEVPIARDPEGVARWWLDFPSVYEASDPREQPYRIETVDRTPRKIVVKTSWRMMGMQRVFDETITIVEPLLFDAHITMGRIEVVDVFRVQPDGKGGSTVAIQTRMVGRGLIGALAARMMAPFLHRFMRRIWRDAGQLCEEDGRRVARVPGAVRGPAATGP